MDTQQNQKTSDEHPSQWNNRWTGCLRAGETRLYTGTKANASVRPRASAPARVRVESARRQQQRMPEANPAPGRSSRAANQSYTIASMPTISPAPDAVQKPVLVSVCAAGAEIERLPTR